MSKPLLLSVWMLTGAAAAQPDAASGPVGFPAEDGFQLRGTLWPAAAGSPAILLLHQCDRDRSMFEELGDRLAAKDHRVLSFDFRGLGESVSESLDLGQDGSRTAWSLAEDGFPKDATAALRFLAEQDSTASRIATVGASCGGREQVLLPENFEQVEAQVFLSARISEGWQDRVLARPSLSLLMIAAEGDRGAARAAARIQELTSARDNVEVHILAGSDHGAPLLRRYPELVDRIVEWLSAG